MKNIIYSLLITTSVGSAVYATQQPPQRPTTPPKMAPQRSTIPTPTNLAPLKTDNSICPDELKMPQLNELKEGKLNLAGHKFELHTSKHDFEHMLPGTLQVISKGYSVAKIAEGQILPARTFIPTPHGRILKCTYTFRTALGSKTAGNPTVFSIKSEPTAFEKDLPGELVDAINNAPNNNKANAIGG
jgi:hypothetical protein